MAAKLPLKKEVSKPLPVAEEIAPKEEPAQLPPFAGLAPKQGLAAPGLFPGLNPFASLTTQYQSIQDLQNKPPVTKPKEVASIFSEEKAPNSE